MAVGVKVRDRESVDRALRRFRRTVNRSRLLRKYRSKLSYTKPSKERREAKKRALRNARRNTNRY